MGGRPRIGFLPYRWDYYSELMMMYLLGLGSARTLCVRKPGTPGSAPLSNTTDFATSARSRLLFVHQYSQAWFDFRGKRDRYADYFQNSIIATDVHRRFCLELAKQFPRL